MFGSWLQQFVINTTDGSCCLYLFLRLVARTFSQWERRSAVCGAHRRLQGTTARCGRLTGFLTVLQASLQQTTSLVLWCVNNGEHNRLPSLRLQMKRVGQNNYVHACIYREIKTNYLTSAFENLLACLLLSITVREMQLASFFASSVPMYCC